jgi:hypothetical protein
MGGMGGGMGGGGMGGIGAAIVHVVYRTSDAAGTADFGAVQPGDYRFQIAKNWSRGLVSAVGQLNVLPGRAVEKTIVCPKTPPERVTVRVRCAWPADLEKEQLVLYAPFVYRYRKLQPSVEWSLTDAGAARTERVRRRSNQPAMMVNQGQGFPAIRSILSGPGPMLTEVLNSKTLFLWSNSAEADAAAQAKHAARAATDRRWPGVGFGPIVEGARVGPGDWADILAQNLRAVKPTAETPEPHELEWEPGTYGLDELIVMRPTRSPNVEAGRKRFDVLVASNVNNPLYTVAVGTAPPDKEDVDVFFRNTIGAGLERPSGMAGGMGGGMRQIAPRAYKPFQYAAPTLMLPTEYWDQVELGFEARRGQVNEWTIPLPDELTKAVRDALKTEPTPRVGSDEPVGNLQ